jgi:hypothetical protein
MLSFGGTACQLAHSAAAGQSLAAAWGWVLGAVALATLASNTNDLPRGERRLHRVVLAVLAFGGTLAHVGVALHAGVLAVTMVAFARWLGFDYRRSLTDAAILVVAAGCAALLRVGMPGEINPIHAHVQGVLFVGERLFVMSPMEVLRQFGMVFLGGLVLVPVLAVMSRRRADARIALALCVVPIGIAFVPPIATALFSRGSYMVFRALLNAPVFAASAWVLVALVERARRRGVLARAAVATVVAMWGLTFVRPALHATRADFAHRPRAATDGNLAVVDVVRRLPAGATVLSDPATSYLLSAYSTHRFVALYEQHANPRDTFALDRLQAVRGVISPLVDSRASVAWCERYDVDVVVVSARALSASPGFMTGWDPALYPASVERLRELAPAFQEVAVTDEFALFRFRPGAPVGTPADAWPAPVVAGSLDASACVVVAPERAFEVTGISVTPSPAALGDAVSINIGYRRDTTTPFGLPFLVHARLDHEALVSSRRYPGDKYVRRFEDRRRGVVTRLRADVRPGRGVFEPDVWPIGTPVYERVEFVIPAHAAPGRYSVEVAVVHDSMLPNFHWRDLVFNRDHYTGTVCGTLDVRARAESNE